jgi:hypothetical protein
MATGTPDRQASLWFAIIIMVALVGIGCLYYVESKRRQVDTDRKMYRGDPPPALQNRNVKEGKPANPPLQSAPR